MTATARAKATTFAVVSPTPGRRYTRKSLHAYTHALVTYETVESMVRRAERSAVRDDEQAARYTETAMLLRSGGSPAAGSALLARVNGGSYNMQQAGVRTEWDAVLFSLNHPNSVYRGQGLTAEQFAAQYDAYAAQTAASAVRYRAEAVAIREANAVREWATFHHSYKLALKAAGKEAGSFGGVCVSQIVETTIVTK